MQIPQLGLQHTLSILHVLRPHDWLAGWVIGLLHKVVSHVAPGAVQVPQLGLQHTMPELQVFGPHGTLSIDTFAGDESGALLAVPGPADKVDGTAGDAAAGEVDAEPEAPVTGALAEGTTMTGVTTAGEVATGGGTFTITTFRSVDCGAAAAEVGCGAAAAETDALC